MFPTGEERTAVTKYIGTIEIGREQISEDRR